MEGPPRERVPGAFPGDGVETANPSAPVPQDLRQADRLYQLFPDFESWQGLTEADRDLWDRLFDALHTADEGQIGSLLGFFRDRGIDTMQLVTENLQAAQAPAPANWIRINLSQMLLELRDQAKEHAESEP